MTKTEEDLYISYHRYSTWKQCPAIIGYWSEIPSEERVDDHRNAVVGSVVHELAERYIKGRVTLEKMHGIAGLVFNKFVEEHFVKWRGRSDRSLLRSKLGLHTASLESLLLEHDITPKNSDAEVTHKVEVKIEGEILKIGGRIDCIQSTERIWLYDFKATENEFYLDLEQMYVYFTIADVAQVPPEGGSFLLTHYDKETIVERDPYKEAELRNNLLRVAKYIQEKNLPQTPGRPCGWCEFAKVCPGSKRWKKRKRIMEAQSEDKSTGRVPW